MSGEMIGLATPIVALDVAGTPEAIAMADRLGASCDYYKVGSELFTSAGPEIVRELRDRGVEIFLDLKLHDIPNTVRGAARAAARLGVKLLTVHASGGTDMVRAAVDGAGPSCGILAVTILTSLDADGVARSWGRSDAVAVEQEVLRLAELAAEAGAHGVVCSGAEVSAVRERFGAQLAPLVPGIRFAEGAVHDQRRVVTPESAVRGGARYLVLGRAVTEEPDPASAMARVRAAIRSAEEGGAQSAM